MFNYIKSEFYRLSRSMSTYVTLAIFAALSLIINMGLAIVGWAERSFAYNNTSFSMMFLLQLPSIFVYAAAIIAYIVYEGNRRNGNLKNAVAFGISREKLFIGQFIVSLVSALVVLFVTEGVYFASAYALLRNDAAFTAADVLLETAAALPVAIASLVLALACEHISDRGFVGLLIWIAVFLILPWICGLIGLKVQIFSEIAAWMPMNFMTATIDGTEGSGAMVAYWQQQEGIIKALVFGGAGTVIFGLSGWLIFQRKEV